jgi:hypothetical protein
MISISISISINIEDIKESQEAYENEFLMYQPIIERKTMGLYSKNPAEAQSYLTDYVNDNINKVVNVYHTIGKKSSLSCGIIINQEV